MQSADIGGIETYAGETIEEKVNKILTQNEPIVDGAQLNYTERKDGVKPEYDIRTDRFEHAIDAMERVSKSHIAKREERLKAVKGGAEKGGNESSGNQSNGNESGSSKSNGRMETIHA